MRRHLHFHSLAIPLLDFIAPFQSVFELTIVFSNTNNNATDPINEMRRGALQFSPDKDFGLMIFEDWILRTRTSPRAVHIPLK